MNQSASGPTTTQTFVLRFWHERAGAESRLRGRIEHVQSGRRQDFLYLAEMLSFLRQMGVPLDQIENDHAAAHGHEN